MKHLHSATLAIFIVFAASACPSENDPGGPIDAGVDPIDMLTEVDAGRDAGATESPDASDDVGAADEGADVSSDAGLPTFSATVSYDGEMATLDRAYFGITAASESSSGELELYMEAYSGGVDGCPSMDSPTPDLTVIIAGLRPPDVAASTNEQSGLVVSVLDFQGNLTTEPILRATGESLTFTDWSDCVDCRDGTEQFVAFSVDAPLDAGSVSGDFVATYCPSLDAGF